MTEVTMPQLGETVAEGTVTKWFKGVGETVARGEPLFEVSTDKVDTEIPAQSDGVISTILVEEGATVDVGTILAVISDGSETAAPTSASNCVAETLVTPSPANLDEEEPATECGGQTRLTPVVRRLLEEHGLDASQILGSGPRGRITRNDVLAAASSAAESSAGAPMLPTSPVVRRLIVTHQIDPTTLAGSGPGGRVTRQDVEDAIASTGRVAKEIQGDDAIPFTRIRRLTAEHMVRSKATSAHTMMVKEIDYERVEQVRRVHGLGFKESEGFSLTYLPFNVIAVVEALREFPILNASVGNDELIMHRNINIGIAVDLDQDGLVVPVIRDSGSYDLTTIARRIRELALQARSKKLTVDDMSNGTFTITNPGPYGTLLTGAIINQPQVAILATDGVSRKPVVIGNTFGEEAIGIHSVGLLALTFDHRAIDGAYAARFLSRVSEILNARDWDAELSKR
jgi:2-oxoglutarate dehydrogenase E2 component (dihydrolipoamide succinyltransferase)